MIIKKNQQDSLKSNKTFLERFEGKKTVISKEGLIHIFDKKQ